MKVLLSWIREFVDVPESPEEIGKLMGVRGLPLEGLEKIGDDAILDFETYANRPDTLSIIGVAREIAAAYGRPLKKTTKDVDLHANNKISITIQEPELCARYVGAVADVTVGPSPQWMQDRLTACGVRPISNIVDITNYVMLELGQPMHAFDLAKMRGGVIIVRRAKAREAMTTLDGKMRTLTPNMLVIADQDNAEDIGGVMGGANSEITNATKQVVFEAAWFHPEQIRATSKALGLKSEASTRFERGADRTAPPRAMARAFELLVQIGAGKPTGVITDAYPTKHQPASLVLERRRVTGLLGMDIPDPEVERILTALGFGVKTNEDGFAVTIPAWRVDVKRQVDLIEEVGRHYGFENLPATCPGVQQAPRPSDPRIARDRRVRNAALGMGFSEAITFGFIEEKAASPFLDPSTSLGASGPSLVTLANPLSEKFTTMRPSLLPGLIDAVSHNRRHGRRDVRLFEIGTRFSPTGESRGLGLAWTGLATPDHWIGGRRDVEFLDIKGVCEQIAAVGALTPAFTEVSRSYLVDGRAANVVVNGEVIGVFGQLAQSVAEARDLPTADPVYVAEFNLDRFTAHAPEETLRAVALAKFPAVARDVSLLIDESLSAETVRGTIRSVAPDTLTNIREFDRYQGKGVPEGKISLSLRLTFQSPARTLTDAEVQSAMQVIVGALIDKLKAVQR